MEWVGDMSREIVVARSVSIKLRGSIVERVDEVSDSSMYCCLNAVRGPALAKVWLRTLYAVMIVTRRFAFPSMVMPDHRPFPD